MLPRVRVMAPVRPQQVGNDDLSEYPTSVYAIGSKTELDFLRLLGDGVEAQL